MPDIKAQNETTLASVKAIYDAADEANTLLDGMQVAAQQAGTTLNGIYQDAMDAQASATQAGEYASRALGNLSTVQSVAETLNWIASHGTMTLTTDTQLDPSHVYFVADQNGDYVVGGQHYAVVNEPDVADISTYYELSIDESLNNYVATHLAVDSEGLWVLPNQSGYKVLIATGNGSTYTDAGTYIIDENSVSVAKFGTQAVIGNIDFESSKGSALTLTKGSLLLEDELRHHMFEVADLYYGIVVQYWEGDGSRTVFFTDYDALSVSSIFKNGTLMSSTEYTFDRWLWQGKYVGRVIFTTAPADGDELKVAYHTQEPYFFALSFGGRDITTGDSVVGYLSSTFGQGLIAQSECQMTIGEWNDNQTGTLFEIGNGTADNARSNAFTVDWSGNVVASGDITADDMLIDLPDYQTASTTDKAIYDAVVALGWDSDVLVN